MRGLLRRVKAAVVNAAFWGATWLGIGVALNAAMSLIVGDPVSVSAWLATGLFTGAVGASVGGLFSAFIAIAYRHRRVEDLGTAGFVGLGIATAVLAAPVVMFVLSGASSLPGSTIELLALGSAAGVSGLIGAFTAFGTLRIAQHGSESERLAASAERSLLGSSSR